MQQHLPLPYPCQPSIQKRSVFKATIVVEAAAFQI